MISLWLLTALTFFIVLSAAHGLYKEGDTVGAVVAVLFTIAIAILLVEVSII